MACLEVTSSDWMACLEVTSFDWMVLDAVLCPLVRYIEGGYHDSIALCLKILRQKPWHFGAGR